MSGYRFLMMLIVLYIVNQRLRTVVNYGIDFNVSKEKIINAAEDLTNGLSQPSE